MNRVSTPAEAGSLWAAVTPPGVACPSLDTDFDVDTVVIGAGRTLMPQGSAVGAEQPVTLTRVALR